MVARSEDEIVFWTHHLAQKCSGVLWVKGEASRWIPSPEPKEQQDVWGRSCLALMRQRNTVGLPGQ